MKRKSIITFLVLSSMLFLSACGGKTSTSTSTSAVSDKSGPIKIGVVTSLSGPYAVIGEGAVQGMQFAADEINQNGGVLGRKIEVLKEDDEGKPDIGLRKAEKIVTKDGAHFIIGSVSSAVGLAIGSKMPEWNAIYVSTINKTPKLTTTNFNKNIFQATQDDIQDMDTIQKWYQKSERGKNWYMIGADYEWGHSSLAKFKKIVEDSGDKILGEAYTPLGTTDFSSQITNILASKPDGVWAALSGSDGVNFLKQAKSFGLTDKVKIATFLTDPVINAIQKDAIGVVGDVNYYNSMDFPLNKKFAADFEKKFGKKPTNYAGSTYIGAEMIFKGIEKAGSTDTKEVIKALEGLSFESLLGTAKVQPDNHKLTIPDFVGEVVDENGKAAVKMIYTAK